MDWSAVPRLIWENAYLGIVPALIGLVISLPLGIACTRWKWLYPPVLSATSVLYALPSLALFIVLIPYTGLTDTTVIIPLTLFSLCVLVPERGGRDAVGARSRCARPPRPWGSARCGAWSRSSSRSRCPS